LSTKRIKLVVAYDGTDFRGWAAQTGQRAVQSTLTEAVRRATGEDVEIIGASRTDSGAHALGQVCHFDTVVDMETDKWPRVLNNLLEADLAVQSAEDVAADFNCRFCADYRRYRYRINLGPRNPFTTRFVHEYGRQVDLSVMKEAASLIVGTHDFRGFTEQVGPEVENTVRQIFHADINAIRDTGYEINRESHIANRESKNEIAIEITGTAFLRGMMRRISGALLEIGRGHRPLEDMAKLLTSERDSLQWPTVLPAKGLCLMEVAYTNPPRDNRTASILA
jgi:tRNA pseudouridine38-40 synthase